MRIAVIHSYYSSRQPSGENIAVDAQVAALREAGHDVLLVPQRTDEREQRRAYLLEAAWTVSTGSGPSPLAVLRRFAPDIVHVHNLFPNWGTRWLKQLRTPLVATVHNFRAVCAAGTLYRSGAPCEECPTRGRAAAFMHGCYRGSRVASAPVALATHRDASRHPVVARADRVIVLSQRSVGTLCRFGLDPSKTDVIPNFVLPPPEAAQVHAPNGRWIYVGRLSPEKGILELLKDWPTNQPLDVVGDGPLAPSVARAATGSVRFLGPMSHDEVLRALPNYAGLAFPSRWQEGAPLVALEAFASGLPVVAAPGNTAADLVVETGAGLVVGSGLTWATAIAQVAGQPSFRAAALAAFNDNFSQAAWLDGVLRVYQRATESGSP